MFSTPPSTSEETPAVTSSEREPQPRWGETTDPREHDPKRFRYLVHAFNSASLGMNVQAQVYGHSARQAVNLVNEPLRVAERVSVSMSLIDQDHTQTWGSGGLILDAPPETIMVASPKDAGVTNADERSLRLRAQQQPPLPADEVLRTMSPKYYNEVVALGTDEHTGASLRLKGFFMIQDSDGDVADPKLQARLKQHAETTGLPFVAIDESRFKQEAFTKNDQELTYQNGGRQYCLYDKRQPYKAFKVDTGVKEYFMTKDEVKQVVTDLYTTEKLTESEGRAVLRQYIDAYKRWVRPIVYEDDGVGIMFKTSAGPSLEEYQFQFGAYTKLTTRGAVTQQEVISLEGFTQAVERYRAQWDPESYERIQRILSGARG